MAIGRIQFGTVLTHGVFELLEEFGSDVDVDTLWSIVPNGVWGHHRHFHPGDGWCIITLSRSRLAET